MIEINLIPDVKLELLKARRQRSMITSAAVFVAIAAGGLVVLLSFYTFGVQTVADGLAGNAITDETKKLKGVKDLSKTLTIQNQLSKLKALHDKKNMTSRVFDIIATAVPKGKNSILISRISLDTEENTITIEGEAANGYEALEVFKKTIEETKFKYNQDGEAQDPVRIATKISDGERRYGENSDGKRVLRFSMSFEYSDELFERTSQDGTIVAPDRQNATDSLQGVPTSLFTNGEDV